MGNCDSNIKFIEEENIQLKKEIESLKNKQNCKNDDETKSIQDTSYFTHFIKEIYILNQAKTTLFVFESLDENSFVNDIIYEKNQITFENKNMYSSLSTCCQNDIHKNLYNLKVKITNLEKINFTEISTEDADSDGYCTLDKRLIFFIKSLQNEKYFKLVKKYKRMDDNLPGAISE